MGEDVRDLRGGRREWGGDVVVWPGVEVPMEAKGGTVTLQRLLFGQGGALAGGEATVHCGRCGQNRQHRRKQVVREVRGFVLVALMRLRADGSKIGRRVTFGMKEELPDGTALELCAVAAHGGESNAGHYVAYLQQEGGWLLANGGRVTCVSDAEVKRSEAAMLLYRKVA